MEKDQIIDHLVKSITNFQQEIDKTTLENLKLIKENIEQKNTIKDQKEEIKKCQEFAKQIELEFGIKSLIDGNSKI